ncbi:MAG TPA: LamG domain-containing protein, partial [Pyrinomonadaceae bacterium]|nr:LamG domain-containing protein [Pyrinomonadaceae bacterium]
MKITNKTTHWLLMCFFTLATLAFPLISVVGQTNLPCTPPPTGMVAWYPSDGNALDIQGANNGTLNNGATFTTTANGKVREAFSFDGNDDYVEIPDSAALNNTTATWSFWFKASQVSNDSGLLGKHNAPASLNGISIFLYNNKLGLQIKGSNTSQAVGLSSNTTITAGQFYHVSIAFQSGGTVQLYINGMLEATGTAPTFSFTSQPLRLGRQIDTYWSAFNGAIDEFSIFNRILQHHEIRAIYNSGANGKCKPCAAQPANIAAWYSGDDTAADMSGSGSSGTLQNGASFAAGKAGQSFVFDGVDDYVSVPDSPNLNPTAQISLEAWVYPTSDTAGAGDVVMAIAGKDGFPFQYFISRRNSVACSVGGGIPTGNLAFYINGLSGLPG